MQGYNLAEISPEVEPAGGARECVVPHGFEGLVVINGHTMRQVARSTISCRGAMSCSKQPPS